MSSEPSQKRYDRQVRIWGAHGQSELEKARVCLLNASATGSEALKNLVLGGIRGFTIIDEKQVQARDLGNNFLLEKSNLGKSRAQCVTESLKELNPSISGGFVEDTVQNVLASGIEFFQSFELVIATQMSSELAAQVDKVCRSHNIQLIFARSYGLAGFVRISVKEHQVIESRPEHPAEDLRLHDPWAELHKWAQAFNLDTLEEADRSHVPFVALIIQAADKWRSDHGGSLPKTYAEKQAFKELLRSWEHSIDGIPIEDENFKEALENRRIFSLSSPAGISHEVRTILDDPAASEAGKTSDSFWTLVAALKAFVASEGAGTLPLEGSIPDMTAQTATYLELQRIYRERAERDIAALKEHVAQIESSKADLHSKISAAYIRLFAKNARNLRLYRYPTLEEEDQKTTGADSRLQALLDQEDSKANGLLYLLFKAVDDFSAQHHRLPGSHDSQLQEDTALLKAKMKSLVHQSGRVEELLDDYTSEMVRAGGSELHVIATIIGGIASQEAIKLLTHQFCPINGTLMYNGMACTSSVLRFE